MLNLILVLIRLTIFLIGILVSGQLGFISQKYESGTSGPGTISSGVGDPGGKSYGLFQLSSKTGTLAAFLYQSGYVKDFYHIQYGSSAFDVEWKRLAETDPNFGQAQHDFIEKRLYQPVKEVADYYKLPDTPAVNETLWSMAVQHGRAKDLVTQACLKCPRPYTEINVINELFTIRENYVRSLGMSYLINNRYVHEQQDILNYAKDGK